MFIAQPKFPLRHRQDAECHDQDLSAGKHRIAPAIDEVPDLGFDPQLFRQLPLQAGNRILPRLKPAMLSGATRTAMKADPECLPEIRRLLDGAGG